MPELAEPGPLRAPEVTPLVSVYAAIRRIARVQRTALATGDLTSFQALLNERERLLDQAVDRLETGDHDLTAARRIAREVLAIDRDSQRLLALELEQVSIELADGARGQIALEGYRSRRPDRPRLVDING